MSPDSFVFGSQASGLPRFGAVVPSSMADAVRKEICNNLEEETAHVSVSLPGLFGLTITKTLEC